MCAVQLASDYIDDCPISISCWRDAQFKTYAGIENIILDLLFAIDWRLHSLSTPDRIGHTVSVFLGEAGLQDSC